MAIGRLNTLVSFVINFASGATRPDSIPLPYSATDDWCKVIVRAELQRACKLADIAKISPLQIRDTGLQQWARADYHVSKVLHGCQLGVIGRYVDPLDIIEPVSHRVRLPSCFGAIRQESDDLTSMILKLDPDARRIVNEMTLRLARCISRGTVSFSRSALRRS